MIIDAHAHPYSPDEAAYPPIEKPLRPPFGTGTPEHLRHEMKASGVDHAVLVQVSSFYGWDNRFLRDTSASSREWAVGVCTLNPDDANSPDTLYALVDRSNVRGMRSLPGADGRLNHPGVRQLWAEAMGLGIVVNPLVPLSLADELAVLLDDYPALRVVLDHCFSLRKGPDYDAKVSKVIEMARHPNLHLKLTFIPVGSAERHPFRDVQDDYKRFIEVYGPERCVWGSGFPVELWCPKVSYEGHLDLFRKELGLTEAEQAEVLGGTAQRLWFD